MAALSITFSIAEQSFESTRSIGVLNLSLNLLKPLGSFREVTKLTVLSNHTFDSGTFPPSAEIANHDEANGRGLRRIVWDQFGVYNAAGQAGNQWLFLPKGFASFLRRPPVLLATYVHDLMFEFYARHYPRDFSRAEGIYLRNCLKGALRHAKVIFTNSRFTAEQLAEASERWAIKAPPIHPVGIGFSPVETSFPKENRILVTTSRWPHKRTDLTLAYLDQWQKQSRFDGIIDFVGGLPKHLAFPPHRNWRLHERVPEADYRRMMATCRAMVYFSEHEGFGMPPVEATLAGAAAVYSDIPACSEAMLSHGYRFSNNSWESFASALNAALDADPKCIKDAADNLLQQYKWDAVARRVVDALVGAG